MVNLNIDVTDVDQAVEFFSTLEDLEDQELWAVLDIAQGSLRDLVQEELAARLAFRMPGGGNVPLTFH